MGGYCKSQADVHTGGIAFNGSVNELFQSGELDHIGQLGIDLLLFQAQDRAIEINVLSTGEIRMSILWEWIHKGAKLNEDDPETGAKAGDVFTAELFAKLLEEEHEKLLRADNRDVHDNSKHTTLPIVKEIVRAYAADAVKPPWYVDFLNINLNNHDLEIAMERTRSFMAAFKRDGTRITANLDLVPDAESE